jgi:hypothetical protein
MPKIVIWDIENDRMVSYCEVRTSEEALRYLDLGIKLMEHAGYKCEKVEDERYHCKREGHRYTNVEVRLEWEYDYEPIPK